MTAQLDAPVLDFGKLEEFAGKVAADQAAAYNAILVYLGDRLGLWRALADLGTATVAELAERSGVTPRYVQEWLSAQAANGYVTYDAATESFTLSVEAAAVLAEEESPAAMMAGFELIAAVWAAVDRLAQRLHDRRGHRLARARPAAVQCGRPLLRHDVPQLAAHRVAARGGRPDRAPRSPASACSTSAAASAYRRSCWPRRSRTRPSSASTTTRSRSARPRGGRRRPGSPTASTSRSPTRRRTPAATTWCCSSTPSTTSATRSARSPTPGACWHRAAGRRGRAVRRGHPRGEPGQPDRGGVLRRQLGTVRAAQRLRRRCRARRAGRTGPAHRPRSATPVSRPPQVAIATATNLVIEARS